MKLKDIKDLIENPEKFDWYITDDRHYQGRYKVKFYEETCLSWNPDRFYLCGFEYGATHLIHCMNESDAWDCWLDLLPPVPMDEVHEAYNAFDKMLEFMQKKGHENDYHLRSFCNSWCRTFFEISTRNANMTGAWDEWELGESLPAELNGQWYRPRWMNEIEIDRIEVEHKAEVTA